LLVVALAQRADLVERTRAIREAEALTAAARRERIPNLRLGVFVERRPEAGSATGARFPRVGPALGITLPFVNRNQGLVAQRQALATQARFARDAVELQVRTDVATATRAYETASAELSVFTTTVLEPARRNSTLLDTAFQAGKIPLPTLLLLRNQLLDAELGYWDAWLARHTARVQLDAATGALQPPAATSRASTTPSSGDRR
jgi:cobalt-zinc-cadmium efflux system outer membrane protein